MRSSPSTTTIRRSFWILLGVAFVVEVGTAVLAARAVHAQLVCHWSALDVDHSDVPACFHAAPLVGMHAWLPAVAVAIVVLASVVLAVRELVRRHRKVRDRRAELQRCGPSTPAALAKVARSGLAHVRVVGSERAICYTIGYLRPEIVVSTRTTEILTPEQLQAALTHEASHRRRRDPLRIALAKVAAAMSEPTSGASAMAATELLGERMVVLLGGEHPRIELGRRRVVVSAVALLLVVALGLAVPSRTPAPRPQQVHRVSVIVHR